MTSRNLAVLLLLVACGRPSPTEPPIVTLQCASPAPLLNADHRAYPDRVIDEYVVLLRSGSNVIAESARLAAKHQFVVSETFTIVPAFGAELAPGVVASLRCEPVVESVSFSHTNIPPPQ